MWIEIAIVLVLILVNGLLAMSEMAIVSARPARMKVMAERGDHGAAIALRLAEEPGRFLSSVQIGITLVGVLSGAFSGATLGARLAAVLPSPRRYSVSRPGPFVQRRANWIQRQVRQIGGPAYLQTLD